MNPFLLYSIVGVIPVLLTDGALSLALLGLQLVCLLLGIISEKL